MLIRIYKYNLNDSDNFSLKDLPNYDDFIEQTTEVEKKETKKVEVKGEKNQNSLSVSSSLDSNSNDKINIDKRKVDDNTQCASNKKIKNKITKPFNKLLEGVVMVISGIENPERATIRAQALEMGAKYRTSWENGCTHLVCAFNNTPKFNQAKGTGKIVNRKWVVDCHSQRKGLSWRKYVIEKAEHSNDDEDEIWEENEVPSNIATISDSLSDADRTLDIQNEAKDSSSDTDEEDINCKDIQNHNLPELPNFMLGKIIYVDKLFSFQLKELLIRYITSFNGTLTDKPSNQVNYAISAVDLANDLKSTCTNACIVTPDWIWKCHNVQKLVATDSYEL